jgi:hypothetical protein
MDAPKGVLCGQALLRPPSPQQRAWPRFSCPLRDADWFFSCWDGINYLGANVAAQGNLVPSPGYHPESNMSAETFSPALAESMDIAFKRVCKSLGAKPGQELATRAAAKIVELVNAGMSDPDELYRAVLNELEKR